MAGEDLFAYLTRVRGGFDEALYRRVVGAASAFKEGDAVLGLAAPDDATRATARGLLAATRVGELQARPLFEDRLYAALLADLDAGVCERIAGWTLGALKEFLLTAEEAAIHAILPGLASDVIACVVKLMSDAELTALGARVYHPLPGRTLGARGYLSARLQPNSPTDDPEDIRWQVFDGWSYAVGDLLLGTNPVSSDPDSVAVVEATLHEIRTSFGVEDLLPHCVLAHVDVQAEVEARAPGSTGIWFQSLAGSDAANATFGVSLGSMLRRASERGGKYGMYFETGQGADCTNGHAAGVDMVVHEARKYGFCRLLTRAVAAAQIAAGRAPAPWVHVNDVAGFIGPEVFRRREQLIRCCLEDIAMGKLHGLTIGLDVCSTLHMDVDLDDLELCLDAVAAAGPAYLMALPTRNDPMLGYLTTGFHDHLRLRARTGLRVDEAMWGFFRDVLEVVDAEGQPTWRFGQPLQVFLRYQRARGDLREEAEILAEGRERMAAVQARGVPLVVGSGAQPVVVAGGGGGDAAARLRGREALPVGRVGRCFPGAAAGGAGAAHAGGGSRGLHPASAAGRAAVGGGAGGAGCVARGVCRGVRAAAGRVGRAQSDGDDGRRAPAAVPRGGAGGARGGWLAGGAAAAGAAGGAGACGLSGRGGAVRRRGRSQGSAGHRARDRRAAGHITP